LLRSGDGAAAKDLLPGIAGGESVATLAVTEDNGSWTGQCRTVGAQLIGGGWAVTGTKTFVPDGHVADLILVAARTGSGLSLFAVEATAPGLSRTPLPTLDQTRKQARLDFDAVPGRLVGAAGEAGPVVERTLATAAVLLAAEQIGGASRALELAVDYAKLRTQYGRPIGSFQGIKHLCADLLVEIEAARSALYDALWSLEADSADLPLAAAIARVFCSEAYSRAAGDCVQVHGGIGFTWEHPAHLHVKRAKSGEVLLGTPAQHRERVAVLLGL
jgi:alkylation response protein AidB-like acyl-CoA dehydrogenase